MQPVENTRILLVEDDQNFGDVLANYLQIHEFDIHLVRDGAAGWQAFCKEEYDLCILDVMMPKKDGFSLAQDIREINKDIPIIFLTAKTMKEDVLEGFQAGADDYLTKPFHTEELLMRIQALMRRAQIKTAQEPKAERHYQIGKYSFDTHLRLLQYGDDKENIEKLSPKESELLKLFCMHLNNVLERSVALKKIWKKDDYFTARSMDVFVTKLRKYLKNDPAVEIVNIHGNGFQLLVKENSI